VKVWRSADGRSWGPVSPSTALSGFCHSRIAGGPRGYVLVGWDCSEPPQPVIATSTDGRTWARAPEQASLSGASGIAGVVAGGPGWIAFGPFLEATTGNAGEAVWISVDGVAWRRTSFLRPVSPYVPDCGPGDSAGIADIAPYGPGYVAVGWSNCGNDRWGAAWASPDGATWHSVRVSPTTNARFWLLRAVAVHDGRLVAAAAGPWVDYWPAAVSAVLGP
jgi:hypothetical protein